MLDRYLALLRDELARPTMAQHVFPGVRELLDALEARDDVVLGLLTGNIRRRRAREARRRRHRPGPFRRRRVRIRPPRAARAARDRAPRAPSARSGIRSPATDVVVIGDTPADVACGASIGARAIGVATGRYSVDELRACDAAAVFADLSDTARRRARDPRGLIAMLEVELKSVVDDVDRCRAAVERAGAKLVFAGRLEDRR